ncbi:MAG: phosphatase PAP2 family protein [Bacteroidota bacterium]|nr:phosphatase PAP2 family protein [Bacteroidota bacterium]
MKFVSWWGVNEVAITSISLVSFICLIKSMYREAIFVVLTSLTSITNFGLKLLVSRSRPTDDLVQIIEKAHNNSFPSGHTAHYVTFFGFLLVVLFRLRNVNNIVRFVLAVFFLALIVSVPFSRIYLGAHWFTDVIAGFLLGLIFLAVLLYSYFKKPYELKK